jgi:hypothetical protein
LIATSVVGDSSCLRKIHLAGYISANGLPSRSTVTCAVIICFWPSSVMESASWRTTKLPTFTCCPGLSWASSFCLKPSPAKPKKMSTMPRCTT